jgi:hypothetical protein
MTLGFDLRTRLTPHSQNDNSFDKPTSRKNSNPLLIKRGLPHPRLDVA